MSSTAEHNALVARCRKEFGRHPDIRMWLNSKVHMTSTGPRAKPGLGSGTADIIAVGRGGQFVAPECKTGDAVQTPGQRMFARWVEQMGGYAPVFRSVEEFSAIVTVVSERGKVLAKLWDAVARVGVDRVIDVLEGLR